MAEIGVTLEAIAKIFDCPVIWVLRGGPEHRKLGDPYSFAATLVVPPREPVRAVLKGLSGIFPPQARAAIGAALAGLGLAAVEWERADGTRHRHDLSRYAPRVG